MHTFSLSTFITHILKQIEKEYDEGSENEKSTKHKERKPEIMNEESEEQEDVQVE